MFQILIVEDDKELSQLFQKVLEKNGYQVKSASDGAQAVSYTHLDVYKRQPMTLIKGHTIYADNIDSISYYREHPLVLEAIQELSLIHILHYRKWKCSFRCWLFPLGRCMELCG